jgi:hypothetical protein
MATGGMDREEMPSGIRDAKAVGGPRSKKVNGWCVNSVPHNAVLYTQETTIQRNCCSADHQRAVSIATSGIASPHCPSFARAYIITEPLR